MKECSSRRAYGISRIGTVLAIVQEEMAHVGQLIRERYMFISSYSRVPGTSITGSSAANVKESSKNMRAIPV
jgi:hypothetical protein